MAVIEHPPGDETQWDWAELPDPPMRWGWGSKACLLAGALAHSGRWRGWLSASMDQPHLIAGLDRVTRALGGLTAAWRFDRMATVVHPESGRVTASFAAVAKHYGVSARPCPPRRGNRKGVVEKANHVAAQRFWRTLADDVTPGRPSNSSTLVRPARGRAAARDRRRQGHRRRSRRPRAAAPRAARSQGMTIHVSLGNPRAGAGRQG